MSSGTQIIKNGAVTGTGQTLDVRTVGFRPRRVELYNETGLATLVWTDTMREGRGVKSVTTGTISIPGAGLGLTPLSDGFRIGADTDINVAGEIIHWTAQE